MRDEFTAREISETPRSLTEMSEINRRLQSVVDEAPSDSVVELEVMKEPRGYKALLKVYSSQARFVGGSRAGKFNDVIDDIFSEVRAQLHDWKGRRNLDRATT